MGLIPDDIISQVLDRCDIVETIASYVPLKRAGRNFKTNCPFHNEKTPSFIVNPDKQIFHCFGCGVGGNVITFVIKQEHLEFPEAVRMLATKVGVDVPSYDSRDKQTLSLREILYKANELAVQFFNNNLISSKDTSAIAARDYLKGRDVNLETVQKLKLGFALDRWDRLLTFLREKGISLDLIEKAGLIVSKENCDGFYDRFRNRIIFPIFDVKSRCIAFGARAMKEGIAKYINSPETTLYVKGNHLYGLHLAKEAIREKDSAIIVEGYMDFIMPFQAGVKNIVASLGTALTVDQIRLFRRYTKNVIMLFDTDQAGTSATIRSLDLLIEEDLKVKVATLRSGEDPDSFIRKHGLKEFNSRIEEAQSLFDYKLKVLMGQHSHKSVDGKEKISSEMLPTVAKLKNAVARYSYIKQLAEALSVSEEALLLELQKVPQYSVSKVLEKPKGAVPGSHPKAVERDLLKLILHDEECMLTVKETLDVSDFQDDHIKDVMSRLFDLVKDGKEINVSRLIREFENKHIVQMISELAAAEYLILDNKEKMLHDYISRLKQNRLKHQRQILSNQIKLAEDSGDQTSLNEYRQEYNQLLKKR